MLPTGPGRQAEGVFRALLADSKGRYLNLEIKPRHRFVLRELDER